MASPDPQPAQSRLEIFSEVTGLLAIAIGASVLAGWAGNIGPLKRVLPGLVSMNPMTAVFFALAGFSLWLQRQPRGVIRVTVILARRRWARVCALLVLGGGLLKLANYTFGWEFGIDQVLFPERLASDAPDFPNRMSPNTAMNFIFLGSALLLLDVTTRRGRRPAEFFAIVVALISLLALLGYAYGAKWLYSVATFIPMALHTAVVFQLMALGILCARRDTGLMAIAVSDDPGGRMARRLLPGMILTVFVLGWLCLEGQRHDLYGAGLSVTLYTVANIIIFAALIWWSAAWLHRADAEMKQRAVQLEAANKELESFSYSVSHDLRAPLRHIHGYVGMLTKSMGGQLSEKSERYLKTINDSSLEMGRLIDDLLEFSRMSRVEVHETDGDLNELVRDTIQGLEMATRGRNIVWKIAPLPPVTGDFSLLKQVFTNLIGNAVKYSGGRDPAEIEVGVLGRESGRVIFFVKDNGAGFDMRYVDKLFGVFQRLHSAQEFEGTGIGLATVRRIIARHGGRVWAEGSVGAGATFYFTLKPVA